MILVAGATGLVGGEICRRLIRDGNDVRALVRPTSDATTVADLASGGVEIVRGDVRDAASLEAACRGVDAVVTTAPAMPSPHGSGDEDLWKADADPGRSLVEAARGAGVERFVYVSCSLAISLDCLLGRAGRETEESLVESGLGYTILRPVHLMEVWLGPLGGFDADRATATIHGSGHNAISWISAADVAEFAVRSLSLPAAIDRTIELGGPEPLSPLQVVSIFEEVAGRQFELEFISEDALRERQEASQDPMQEAFAALRRSCARGRAIDMRRTADQYGIALTSVAGYARHAVGPRRVALGRRRGPGLATEGADPAPVRRDPFRHGLAGAQVRRER